MASTSTGDPNCPSRHSAASGVVPSCRQLADAIATDGVERLGWFDRLRHLFHAWRCPPCRHYQRQLESIGVAAREAASENEPDADLLETMQRRCLEKLQARDTDS